MPVPRGCESLKSKGVSLVIPISVAAHAAQVERAIFWTPHHAVDASFNALTHWEHGALVTRHSIRTRDAFGIDARHSAVRDIAHIHLPAMRAVMHQHGLAGRISNLAVREPHHRRLGGFRADAGFLVTVEGQWLIARTACFQVIHATGGHPAALIVTHKEIASDPATHAVGGAKSTSLALQVAAIARDAPHAARTVRRGKVTIGPRHIVGEPTAQWNAGTEPQTILVRNHVEGELVVVGTLRPSACKALVAIGMVVDAVRAGINETRDLAALRDDQRAVHPCKTEWLGKTLSQKRWLCGVQV